MSVRVTAILLSLMSCAVFSCNKAKHDTAQPLPLAIPSSFWLLPSFASYAYNTQAIPENVWGILISCKTSAVFTDSFGVARKYSRDWEHAVFANTLDAYDVDAGVVSVNGSPINYNAAYSYKNLYNDTLGLWRERSDDNWSVSGGGDIPSCSVSVAGTLPQFTGILPVTVSRSKGVSMKFDYSNAVNADKVFLVLYRSALSESFTLSNVAEALGGTVTINPERLTATMNGKLTASLLFKGNDSIIYTGGYLMVVLYKKDVRTIGGKKFAFITQREVVGLVNFVD